VILKDYIDGGFPITRRSPVICTCMTCATSMLLYNRYDLKKFIKSDKKKHTFPSVISCIGIWPGKKTTDGFILNPEAYTRYSPPEEHKDIDSAESITVLLHSDSVFDHIIYIPGSFSDSLIPVVSTDKTLYEYIKNAGLKSKIITNQCPLP